MSTDKHTTPATASSASDDERSSNADPNSKKMPPKKDDSLEERGKSGPSHRDQAGHAGSGDDAELQSTERSQSDRAAGKSS
jgi:hypothetical protein